MTDFARQLFPFPKPPEDKSDIEHYKWLRSTVEERRTKFKTLVEAGKGTEIPGVQGSVYGLYMAATELADHYFAKYHSDNNRVSSIWFGSWRH